MSTLLLLPCRGNLVGVIQQLNNLPFIPLDAMRVKMCVDQLYHLHPALQGLLTLVVKLAARSLAGMGQANQLRTLQSYAAEIPTKITAETYAEINQLISRMNY